MESDPLDEYELTYDFSKAQVATLIVALREYIESKRKHAAMALPSDDEGHAFIQSEIGVAQRLLEKLS